MQDEPLLNVITSHDLDLSHSGVGLPGEEIYFFEELLLMVL